jgi:hypothetical protein
MLKAILSTLVLLLGASATRADDLSTSMSPQPPKVSNNGPRLLFGGDGGYAFGNTFIGAEAGIEAPLGAHFEANFSGQFFPFESHVALGRGFSYSIQPGAIIWINKTSGFEASYHHNAYSVTRERKSNDFVYSGYVYRHTMFGFPTRFHFGYMREVNNGISANGTETNHLQGAAFSFDSIEGCTTHFCVRDKFTWLTGRVLDQANPVCDGTFGYGSQFKPPMPACPRTSTPSGGFEFNLMFQFSRKRQNSNDLF